MSIIYDKSPYLTSQPRCVTIGDVQLSRQLGEFLRFQLFVAIDHHVQFLGEAFLRLRLTEQIALGIHQFVFGRCVSQPKFKVVRGCSRSSKSEVGCYVITKQVKNVI